MLHDGAGVTRPAEHFSILIRGFSYHHSEDVTQMNLPLLQLITIATNHILMLNCLIQHRHGKAWLTVDVNHKIT